jgi:hypothetical protein
MPGDFLKSCAYRLFYKMNYSNRMLMKTAKKCLFYFLFFYTQ